MEIDNFAEHMAHMDFISPNDRYIVHILRRVKDSKGENCLGSNETQRLIRTYYIDSLDYLNKKIPAIKELCQVNNARAYLIVSPKDNFECLLNLGKKVLDTIQNKNYSVKPDHLLRQAYCEMHRSRRKQWILDLDEDNMFEYKLVKPDEVMVTEWTVEKVLEFVKNALAECKKNPECAYVVKTPKGHHIVTEPFDLQKAFAKCNMMFEGEIKSRPVGITWTGPGEFEYKTKNLNGWLKKDGMSILYFKEGN